MIKICANLISRYRAPKAAKFSENSRASSIRLRRNCQAVPHVAGEPGVVLPDQLLKLLRAYYKSAKPRLWWKN
jgi:hypothetical protein